MYHVPPRYKEIQVVGPPHDRIFTMGVLDPADRVIATATARNKKVAEQEASRLALECLDPTEAPSMGDPSRSTSPSPTPSPSPSPSPSSLPSYGSHGSLSQYATSPTPIRPHASYRSPSHTPPLFCPPFPSR
jgi:hypothetical protein